MRNHYTGLEEQKKMFYSLIRKKRSSRFPWEEGALNTGKGVKVNV